MRIVVLGASGPTGSRLVDQALADGHDVVGVARRALSPRPGLTVVSSDVLQGVALPPDVDAVVSVLGVRPTRKPVSLYSAGIANILAAMGRQGVKRLLAVSSSALDPGWRPSGEFFFNHVLDPYVNRVLAGRAHEDMRRMETLVRASGLDWTLVRPSGLFNTSGVTEYLVGRESADGLYTSRTDLAAAMLRELGEGRFVGEAMGVATTTVRPSVVQLLRGTPVAS